MNNLKIALGNVMQSEIAQYEQGAEHIFSKKFEREIARIGAKKTRGPGARRLVTFAAAALAVFSLGIAVGAITTGFRISSYSREFDGKPAKLFTVDSIESSPKTIETVYTVGGLPGELTQRRTSFNEERTEVHTIYTPDRDTIRYGDRYVYDFIWFGQFTREAFSEGYLASDYVTYKELTFGESPAWFITYEHFYGDDAVLIWDAEDYIFELNGNFDEETALELAGSLEVYGREITEGEFEEVLS